MPKDVENIYKMKTYKDRILKIICILLGILVIIQFIANWDKFMYFLDWIWDSFIIM